MNGLFKGVIMIVETEVKLTPKQLAEQYWEMSSIEQTEFFSSLFDVAGMNESYYAFESQAWYLEKDIRNELSNKAKEAIMSLSAPFYLTLLRERYS